MAEPFDEKRVFLAALALNPADRAAFLDGACPDEESRRRVEALLRHHAATTAPIEPGTATAVTPGMPAQLDEFRIISRLGEGGMGVVYLAEDMILGRKVALKVLAAHLVGSEQALARFKDEAKSAAGLRHPAIVPVFKFGSTQGYHYLASEYIEGPTLAAMIDQERRGRTGGTRTGDLKAWHRRAAEIIAAIADALEHSHRAGIVHRDVKPSNILIDERGPRLTDFGIAKHLSGGELSHETNIIGSCHYMSPEQASRVTTRVDHRSDIFSLGVVLYETLCLQRPFDGRDVPQILQAVSDAAPARLRSLDASISRDLETICHKALRKSPLDRYQTAAHMAADLRCFLEGRPILARPPGLARRAAGFLRAHRRAAGAATIVTLLVLLGVSGLALKRHADARAAWFAVEGVPGCEVFLVEFDRELLRPMGAARLTGTTPLSAVRLEPGHYRVTVVREDRAFAEFDSLLLETGRENKVVLRVVDSASAAGPARERELVGVLLSAGDPAANGMIRVPEGEYNLRRPPASHPVLASPVLLEEFMIDAARVTNRQYREFVAATGRAPPRHWALPLYTEREEDLPVVWVTLEDAQAYARWKGKRLATAAEWQAAARGANGDLYPAGDELPPADFQAIARPDEQGYFDGYRRFVGPALEPDEWDLPGRPMRTFSGVREFTSSVDAESRAVILVGRSWADDPANVTLATIVTTPSKFPSPRAGFRCAKSAAPPRKDDR